MRSALAGGWQGARHHGTHAHARRTPASAGPHARPLRARTHLPRRSGSARGRMRARTQAGASPPSSPLARPPTARPARTAIARHALALPDSPPAPAPRPVRLGPLPAEAVCADMRPCALPHPPVRPRGTQGSLADAGHAKPGTAPAERIAGQFGAPRSSASELQGSAGRRWVLALQLSTPGPRRQESRGRTPDAGRLLATPACGGVRAAALPGFGSHMPVGLRTAWGCEPDCQTKRKRASERGERVRANKVAKPQGRRPTMPAACEARSGAERERPLHVLSHPLVRPCVSPRPVARPVRSPTDRLARPVPTPSDPTRPDPTCRPPDRRRRGVSRVRAAGSAPGRQSASAASPAASAIRADHTPARSTAPAARSAAPADRAEVPAAPAAMAKVALRRLIQQVGDVERDFDFVELFAGDGAISTGLEGVGCIGVRVDARRRPEHNFMTPTGFAIALRAVLKLRAGGIFWAAPPCGTWVWVSRASTGRHVRTEGSSWSAHVQNALVERLCLLLRVCMYRKVFWAVEQPASSCMWDYPAMRRVLQRPRPQLGDYGVVREVRLQMGAFGRGFSRRQRSDRDRRPTGL